LSVAETESDLQVGIRPSGGIASSPALLRLAGPVRVGW